MLLPVKLTIAQSQVLPCLKILLICIKIIKCQKMTMPTEIGVNLHMIIKDTEKQ